MNATATPTVNGKPIEICASASFNDLYGGLEAALYTSEALKALRKKPVDMLVFEMAGEDQMRIRSAGYDLATDSILDETTVIMQVESLHIKTFWFKIDDYGDKYVGTFIFPEDY